MWKEANEAQQMAIALDKNRTAERIEAETDLLVEEVKRKVMEKGQGDIMALEDTVHNYMDDRVGQFNQAVANRHQQVIAGKAVQFEALKEHQGKLMEGVMADVVNHGYEVAKTAVAAQAQAVGNKFNNNPKVLNALASVKKANEKWVDTYKTTETAAKAGFDAWSGAYNELEGPWNNVTGTFERANFAAKAARGLGPDTRWAGEVVRISGDVVQAAQTESRKQAAEADLSLSMAEKAHAVVSGNSGSIVTLTDLLDQAESQANQAALAR